jgi:hypothetical protein
MAACVAALALSLAMGGCAQPTLSPSFSFDAEQYPAVFQATKDALRQYQFELERVDARGGVITTWPRQWAGMATPWIPHATDTNSAVVGLIQHELRSCRVTFGVEDGADPSVDLREVTGRMSAKVEVTIHRVHRPGTRIGAPSVRLRSQAIDPELVEEGLQPQYVSPSGPDNALAGRIARAIEAAPPSVTAASEAEGSEGE